MTSAGLIWYIAGGGATLILLVGVCYWSVNFLAQQVIVRSQEQFRVHLAQEVEVALRVFREGMCEQIVLQGKRSDSLAGLYSILIDVLRLGKGLAANCAKGEALQIEKALRAIEEAGTKFSELYQKESLHFPGEFCTMLDGFLTVQQEVMKGMGALLYRKDPAAAGSKDQEIKQNWLRFEDRITATMDLVRQEFHRRDQGPANPLLRGFQDMMSAGVGTPAAHS